MKGRHTPVTWGSPRSTRVATQSVEVVSAWFPPHARLHEHAHSRALFGFMLQGAFRTTIRGRELDYHAASAWTEPAEERHANLASPAGARVLIIQPASVAADMAEVHRVLFDEIVHRRSVDLLADASRLESECAHQDDLSPLVIEGVALALLARGARLFRTKRHDRSPRWLLQVVEYLHAHRFERVQLGEIARGVGVHPSQLAHEFRARLHVSPGDYLRRLRVEWASEQLLDADTSIADIALRAGFCDQSHFSRVFRRHFGIAPCGWRRSHGVGR